MEIKINFGTETINAINNLAGALNALSSSSINLNNPAQTVQTKQESQPQGNSVNVTPPVQETPTTGAVGATGIPTAAASYTREDLARAAGLLVEQKKSAELTALLTNKYTVASLAALPVEHYPLFAADLRALGANI